MTTRIVMVKKIMAVGTPCRKCADIERRIAEGGPSDRMDEVLVADERDDNSPGQRLAAQYQVNYAPFFIVTRDHGKPVVYTSWLRLVNEVLNGPVDAKNEAMELLDRHSDIDLL